MLLLLLAGPLAAQRVERVAVSPQVVTSPVIRPISFEGGVRGYQGLTYLARPGFRPLTLDLYLPHGAQHSRARLPLVIYVHGGGWAGGSPKLSGAMTDFPAVLASLARRGFVVASVSYRFNSEAKFPAAEVDVRSAIRWLKSHADEYGIDATRTGIWGASAGGQLAGLAATACTNPAFDEPTRVASIASPCVQAAVIWYGVLDFATIASQAERVPGAQPHRSRDSNEARYLGCALNQCPSDQLALASPISHIDGRDPPMLLIAGTLDQTVPMEQSRTMADALARVGVKHELMLIPGVNHSFIGHTPEDTRAATQRAVGATFAFFEHYLKAGGN